MKIVENSRQLSNSVYVTVLNQVVGTLKIIDESLRVFSPEFLSSIDSDDYEGLEDYDICFTELEDTFNDFNTREYNLITMRIGEGTYFESRTNDLFLSSLESFKFWYNKLKAKMDLSLKIDFDSDYKELAYTLRKDITFCIINCFQLYLTEREESIQSCVAEYCALYQKDPVEFSKCFMNYYRDNRPSQPLFIKYPEFMEFLEKSVEEEYMYDLIYLSSVLKISEVKDILNGKIYVDDTFLDELKERATGLLSE